MSGDLLKNMLNFLPYGKEENDDYEEDDDYDEEDDYNYEDD